MGNAQAEIVVRSSAKVGIIALIDEATGRKPLKAASGKMMLRIFPEVHAKALATAKTAGKSLNQWAEEVLGKSVQG